MRSDYCQDCQKLTVGDCGKHGPVTYPLPDTFTVPTYLGAWKCGALGPVAGHRLIGVWESGKAPEWVCSVCGKVIP